jgi:hypothetical protein
LKIALCRAPALTIDSSVWRCAALSEAWASRFAAACSESEMEMAYPNSKARYLLDSGVL